MKLRTMMCILAIAGGLTLPVFAQSNSEANSSGSMNSSSSAASDAAKIADQIKALEAKMAGQQEVIADQQEQLAALREQLRKLQQQAAAQEQQVSDGALAGTPHLENATLRMPSASTEGQPGESTTRSTGSPAPPQDEKESPLSFRIGGAEFTPGGFVDFTSIFRTTNTGNLGTNFFSIPFNNGLSGAAGRLSEEKFTAQNSRISAKMTDQFGANDVTAYYEMDFLGNDAVNTNVTSNSHTFRLRLYFLDFKRGKWEFLGGQAWSWLTPNRNGLSPMPDDVFYTKDEDFNYQVGLTWTRAPQFRVVYHPNGHWAMGVALENADQFGGQGEVPFPIAFSATLANQIDEANTSNAPILFPDVIPKIAYDTNMNGKHFHAEVAGLLSQFKVAVEPTTAAPSGFVTHHATGGGVEAAINLELFKGFNVVANAFYSDGGGRYIFGMAPDLVILPTNAPGDTCGIVGTVTQSAEGCDVRIGLVHSASGMGGFEWAVTPHTMLYGYYGGMYAQRNFAADLTSTMAMQPFIGFGGPNSATNNNRAISEPTLGWIQTFWKSPQYGALQLITQASYVTRSPWFVGAGQPKNAHLTMGWVNLRYVLP